jgi:hypothetical protein
MSLTGNYYAITIYIDFDGAGGRNGFVREVEERQR